MKVITLNSYYEPEVAASMYLFANINETLAAKGHSVDVYTPMPSRGISNQIREEYKKKKKEIVNDRIIIHRFALMKEKRGTIKRAFRYILLNMILIWIGLTKKADLIFLYSTPPTNGLVAYVLRKFRKIPIVYCIQDMFPESLIATGITTRDSLMFRLGKLVEKITYKGADHYIVISQDFKDEMLKKGVLPDKITIIRNWVDENAVQRIPRDQNRVLKRYELDPTKFYVSYCGNIGFTQNVELILETAEHLIDQKDIVFLLFGDGAYKEIAEKCIADKKLENVRIFPFQDYEYISDVFSIGNIGIIASKSGVGNCSVPSKTWSYMSAECAVVASFDAGTELETVLNESGGGYMCRPDDVMALEQQILKLFEDQKLCNEVGLKGRQYILKYLTKETGTNQYVNILEKVKADYKRK